MEPKQKWVHLQNKCNQLLELVKEKKIGKLADCTDENSFIPFNYVLEPYRITSEELERMKRLGYLWQKLTHLASKDHELIIKTFQKILEDPLVGPMFNIYKQKLTKEIQAQKNKDEGEDIKEETNRKTSSKENSKPSIELFRTDFFLTQDAKDNIKLIEYNNMSVSMAAMGERYCDVQKTLWGSEKNILKNSSNETFAKGVASLYRKHKLQGIMLAVVQPKETNIYDQHFLFEAIKAKINIRIQKVMMEDLDKETHVDENGDLYFKQDQKVAVVYYRSGYSAKQKIDWAGIQKSNLSNAVNIPSVNAFLIGTKRMQAQLSKKQVMTKYISKEEAEYLISSVIDTWDVDDQSSRQQVLRLIEKQGKQDFVLKPNQEGGRNNFFGEQAYNKLRQLPEKELPHYILTRKIYPRIQTGIFLQAKLWEQPQVKRCEIESEVSIYGCICSKCSCVENCCGGYVVRSKIKGVNQGGIIAGTGALCALQVQDYKQN